jgi:hypothetical protein
MMMVVTPFLIPKIIWLANSRRTIGEMRFTGHGDDWGSALGMSNYPVIRFLIGKDSIYFNGNINLDLTPGQKVPVRYQKNNPSDARVDSFACIWMDRLAYAMLPMLALLVLYFMPDRFDPLFPRHSRIALGGRSFIRLVKPQPG